MNLEATFESDVLVIGGGLAGLLSALEAKKIGVSVSLFTRGKAGLSGSSAISQTMFLVFEGDEGKEELFLSEIFEAGGRLNDLNLLRKVVDEGRFAIRRLQEYGVPLYGGKINENGSRFYKVRGSKSSELTLPLRKVILSQDISLMEGFSFIGFVKGDDGGVGGGLFLKDNKLFLVKAKATVLATGGFAKIYAYSDNSFDTTGEGLIYALDAGAELIDLEFIQFYPYWLVKPAWIGVYASLFAHGAKLRNERGEYFLNKYPKAELETRDILSREIFLQGKVFLDLSTLSDEIIEEINPLLFKILKRYGREGLEVKPVAHFTMGGISVDSRCFTRVPHLFACGECVGGLHGANRVGGMALTECAVFGPIAGKEAALYAKGADFVKLDLDYFSFPGIGNDTLIDVEKELAKIMWECGGIIRSEEGLSTGINKIYGLKEMFSKKKPAKLERWLKLRSMLEISELVLKASLERRESRGAHYRLDYPSPSSLWLKHIAFSKEGGKVYLGFREGC